MTCLEKVFENVLKKFSTDTYGSRLERYIASRNPQNACDVEKLTRDFERKNFSIFP